MFDLGEEFPGVAEVARLGQGEKGDELAHGVLVANKAVPEEKGVRFLGFLDGGAMIPQPFCREILRALGGRDHRPIDGRLQSFANLEMHLEVGKLRWFFKCTASENVLNGRRAVGNCPDEIVPATSEDTSSSAYNKRKRLTRVYHSTRASYVRRQEDPLLRWS
ncbi:hypothetical protein ACLOJK_006142 [Asimina triloba]